MVCYYNIICLSMRVPLGGFAFDTGTIFFILDVSQGCRGKTMMIPVAPLKAVRYR